MENNSDRLGFALIALSVVAFVLLAVNGTLQPTVKGFFNGFNKWETQTFDGINESNKQDVIHTAYANNAEGTDGFTTTKPNLNLSDGTKDFSGDWWGRGNVQTDGRYKGLTVVKRTDAWWGISKTFTAPKDGTYTFSAYVKSSVNNADIVRYTNINGVLDTEKAPMKVIGYDFDWLRDTLTVTLKAEETISTSYNINTGSGAGSGILWTAGHKWEEGSTATPYMPSASEVKPSDQPKYIGTYTDHLETASQEPTKYTWKVNPDYHD